MFIRSCVIIMPYNLIMTFLTIQVITNRDGVEELWLLSSPLQKFMSGTIKSSETNFRIQVNDVQALVWGTQCDVM